MNWFHQKKMKRKINANCSHNIWSTDNTDANDDTVSIKNKAGAHVPIIMFSMWKKDKCWHFSQIQRLQWVTAKNVYLLTLAEITLLSIFRSERILKSERKIKSREGGKKEPDWKNKNKNVKIEAKIPSYV